MKKLLLIASVFLSFSLWAKEFNVENRVNELLKATAQKNYVEFIKSGSTEFKNEDALVRIVLNEKYETLGFWIQ